MNQYTKMLKLTSEGYARVIHQGIEYDEFIDSEAETTTIQLTDRGEKEFKTIKNLCKYYNIDV